MLTKTEKEYCERFLSNEFQMDELRSLVETITERMITVSGKQEAIKAIVSHSNNALELLHRKRVKREHIFRFLASENVAVSGGADKRTLVMQFISRCRTVAPHLPKVEVATVATVPNKIQTGPLSSTFAEQFASWFYCQLNSSAQAPSEWGPQHFWVKSRLTCKLFFSSSEIQTEVFEGAELVAGRFKSFVCDEGLIFNPNIGPSGTSGRDDPHGLFVVVACGTVHRYNMCCGLFEQQFGLFKDPMNQNNWKIQFTNLNLKRCVVQGMPTLQGSP